MKSLTVLATALIATTILAGCATPPAQVLAGMEPQAIDTALQRGRFDLQCPSAEPTVLSRQLREPAVQTIRFAGIPHGIFTIGVSGCGKQMTFQVACPEGGYGCFSIDGLDNFR